MKQWFEDNRKVLVEFGFADNKLCVINGNHCEVTIPEDCLSRIINFDETDHPFSNACDTGGSRSHTYTTTYLPRSSKRSTRGNHHTTSVYGETAAGEILLPFYIFDSKAKDEENFQIKADWVSGLPMVSGKYECPTTEEYSSYVVVSSNGSMNEHIFYEYINNIIKPLYPNVCKGKMIFLLVR